MKKLIYFSIILVFVLLSCTKVRITEKSNSVEAPASLLGTWDWITTFGGFANVKYTPASTGERKVIELTADYFFREYVNDRLSHESKFHIVKSTTIYGGDSTLLIVNMATMPYVSFKIRSLDTLVLYEEAYDGFEHIFKRLK
jgi:hypothetical protein